MASILLASSFCRVRFPSLLRASYATQVANTAATSTSSSTTNSKVNFNLSTASEVFYKNEAVDLVQLPGLNGEYGVTAQHVPLIAYLQPGVITVHLENDNQKRTDQYMTAGGFAITHPNSTTDVTCVECVKLDHIDKEKVNQQLQFYENAMNQTDDSQEKEQAKLYVDMCKHMKNAVQRK